MPPANSRSSRCDLDCRHRARIYRAAPRPIVPKLCAPPVRPQPGRRMLCSQPFAMAATAIVARPRGVVAAALCARRRSASLIGRASARPTASAPKTLGETEPLSPNPPCPQSLPGRRQRDRVPDQRRRAAGAVQGPRATGTIVAWAVDLSRPNKDAAQFFADDIANRVGPPAARISILKREGRAASSSCKQSPVVELELARSAQRPVFTLTDPLQVRRATVVALTTPTWVPNLRRRPAAATSNTWRASREHGAAARTRTTSRTANRTRRSARSARTRATTAARGCSTGPTTCPSRT